MSTNTVTQADYNAIANCYNNTQDTKDVQKKSKVSGRTIGSPELSEKAQKYYAELKKKYSNMDFILVSEDRKAEAQAQAANYANPARMVVLIDTDKIERMAEDENYRKQYEAIISKGAVQLSQMKTKLESRGAIVKSYGMQVKDGGIASFFAAVDKSLAAQKERIEKKAAKKAEEKKKARKTDEKEKAEKRRLDKAKDKEVAKGEDSQTVTANSIEELLQKIDAIMFETMSDYARTEEEKKIGQNFDFRG